MPWNKENLKNHKGMLGLRHSPETIAKMRAKARLRGNNGVGEQFKGIPRPESVKEKMKATQFKKGHETWNKGKPFEEIKGEKHHNWRGGVSAIHKTERQLAMESIEYKLWRRAVFQRDDYTCQNCGIRGGKLHADHIKPWALYPEFRYAIDNGRMLCVKCHVKTDTWGFKVHKL